jgi:hypothetical protein
MSKFLPLIHAFFIAGSVPATAAMTFTFTHPDAVYYSTNFMDGNLDTQWTALGKVGADGAVTDYSAVTPNGDINSVRQIGIGSDYGVGGATGGQRGYLFSMSDGVNNYFTPYLTFSSYSASGVRWDMGNSSDTTLRLLVQSAGTWYATQTYYSTAPTVLDAFKAGGTSFSVNFANSTWHQYDMATLTVMTNTNVSTLPTYNITGVGFHSLNYADNAVMRMDNLSIIPEPTWAIFALPSVLPLLRRRRHRVD